MKLCKLLLAAVGATVLLGSLVSSASARAFSVDNSNIRAAFREVRFHFPEATVICQVTLEGSLHSMTIAKTIGSLIGYITRATLGPCQAGTATTTSKSDSSFASPVARLPQRMTGRPPTAP